MEFHLPFPYRFNPWKHHLQWVCYHIETALKSGEPLEEEIISSIKAINSNQVDIYRGTLSAQEIIQFMDIELHKSGVYAKADFTAWLDKNKFQLLTLKDMSIWVIREGLNDERYIHFHPARNSPNTARIHGNAWKTAIVAKLMETNPSEMNLFLINELRKTTLNLSPIKDLRGSERLQKAFDLLGSR